MEEIIEIDIKSKHDLVEKYNENKISYNLLKYIIRETMQIKQNKKIKIIITKNENIKEDCIEIIKQGLEEEYKRSLEERNRNNLKQLIFFLIGLVFIFIATRIPNRGMWREIILITGWVPIWEMIEIELFPDVYGRRKRKTIKKLLESEIIEEN